jgi:hypothetical protein
MRSLLQSKSVEVSMDTHTTITKHQAALCMALVKVSRLSESPDHYDSVKDLVAYSSIYRTVLEAVQDKDFEWKE